METVKPHDKVEQRAVHQTIASGIAPRLKNDLHSRQAKQNVFKTNRRIALLKSGDMIRRVLGRVGFNARKRKAKTEGRRPKTDDFARASGPIRKLKAENRKQKAESQESVAKQGTKTESRKPNLENRKPKTEP